MLPGQFTKLFKCGKRVFYLAILFLVICIVSTVFNATLWVVFTENVSIVMIETPNEVSLAHQRRIQLQDTTVHLLERSDSKLHNAGDINGAENGDEKISHDDAMDNTGHNLQLVHEGEGQVHRPKHGDQTRGELRSEIRQDIVNKKNGRPQMTQKELDAMIARVKISRVVRPESCDNCFNINFSVLTGNDRLCVAEGTTAIKLVIFVTTSADRRGRRDTIRESWAMYGENNTSPWVRYFFILGLSWNKTANALVMAENKQYKDIVVYDFADTYENLTLKTLVGLKYAATVCPHVLHVLKTDCDVYVNIPALLHLITNTTVYTRNHSPVIEVNNGSKVVGMSTSLPPDIIDALMHNDELAAGKSIPQRIRVDGEIKIGGKKLGYRVSRADNGIYGHLWDSSRPVRNPSSLYKKWLVTRDEYPRNVYPNYMDGHGYILRMAIVHQVLNVSPSIPFFKFEDVYIGLALEKLGYVLQRTSGFLRLENFLTPCSHKSVNVYLVHGVTPGNMRRIWNATCPKVGSVQFSNTRQIDKWIRLHVNELTKHIDT